MKILVIGGHGLIGSRVVDHLKQKHKILTAGRTKGDLLFDMTESLSIQKLFESSGPVDAVVSIAGEATWNTVHDLSEEDYYTGIRSKLMGQVNLVRIGMDFVNHGGSFTLTSGILADDPVPMTASAAMVNGALHSFVKAVAMELKSEQRINIVSSGLVDAAVDKYESYFPGHNPVPMSKVINAYVKCIEGRINGQIIRIYE